MRVKAVAGDYRRSFDRAILRVLAANEPATAVTIYHHVEHPFKTLPRISEALRVLSRKGAVSSQITKDPVNYRRVREWRIKR